MNLKLENLRRNKLEFSFAMTKDFAEDVDLNEYISKLCKEKFIKTIDKLEFRDIPFKFCIRQDEDENICIKCTLKLGE